MHSPHITIACPDKDIIITILHCLGKVQSKHLFLFATPSPILFKDIICTLFALAGSTGNEKYLELPNFLIIATYLPIGNNFFNSKLPLQFRKELFVGCFNQNKCIVVLLFLKVNLLCLNFNDQPTGCITLRTSIHPRQPVSHFWGISWIQILMFFSLLASTYLQWKSAQKNYGT